MDAARLRRELGPSQPLQRTMDHSANSWPVHGLQWGEVVSVTTRGENDHIASCKDGDRYHVFLTAEGRVVVEKH